MVDVKNALMNDNIFELNSAHSVVILDADSFSLSASTFKIKQEKSLLKKFFVAPESTKKYEVNAFSIRHSDYER